MKLDEYMKINGLSQMSFSRDLGISQGYLSRIIAGAATGRPKVIAAIEHRTGGAVTMRDLIECNAAWIAQQASVVSSNQEGEAREAIADQDASIALRPVAGAGPP